MKWTPTKKELHALRRIDAAGMVRPNPNRAVPSCGVTRGTLTRLLKKALVRWGGPVYFGFIMPSKRGDVALRSAGKNS